MLKINEQYVVIGDGIATYANDIIIFDLEKYDTEEYHKWVE